MQKPFSLEGNPLLQLVQLAQLAASLPAANHPAAAAQYFGGPATVFAPPLALPSHPPQAAAAAPTPPPPITATSGTSSDRLPCQRHADATADLGPGPSSSVAGLKLPVTCNDIRGVVYLDQQVVACYCPSCEQRVAAGHGRPLFSFTRFERHSGSKAKKWRLSIRIDPGAVKEAPPDEPPLALGAWLEGKGLVSWAPRGGLKIGPSAMGGGSSDDEGSPLYGDDSGSARRQLASAAADRRQGPIGPRAAAHAAAPAAQGGHGQALAGQKRARHDYETPDLPGHADRQQWLEAQREALEAVATAVAAAAPAGGGGGPGGGGPGGDEAASDGDSGRQRRGSGGAAAQAPAASSTIAKHAAIFSLVYGLLEEGDDRRAFNEVYLPFLADLPPHRLDSEFATLLSYLRLLGGGMGWEAVRGQMSAYVRAVVAKAAAAAG
ncbi:hypothetical protein CHLNCDRAFT_139056 [Chlorella variabilis]|uniref:Uncharacterized protein n=1 Tax=Chlorella variabilis TaxID=554065 RepID=E1ZP94_CHLVA|nr:hypothetical protein CHLNCDRAFT_139056 [Chlorella variabilis]EFN52298.1 hypothetical protein CHLNCDRAFT_139056 [Chlorella variabilis]|eukprot:XP_005844400.1 hypothetical protein CHLNCDRAFT_139056 [Chlorella variabilis]